jgi:hypothetical protein
MASIYDTKEWRDTAAAAKARDRHRCTVARLLGGRCSPDLHAHHLVPLAEGGEAFDLDNVITTCSRHHPTLERLRRFILRERGDELPPCPHNHPYRWGREACERRRRRELVGV